ncbi:MAG: hypothetical protein RI883_1591 [Bacteroidota bacterium]|jgi:hypothetical protein
MRTIYTFLFSSLTIFSINAQYCTAVGPSNTTDSNVGSVQLTGVIGSINYSSSIDVIGLQDLTAFGTTLNAGSSYIVNIQFGTFGGNFPGAGQAWIDYDQNGTFDASESIGTWSGTPPTPLSVFNFNVPAGALNGGTRMRVIQQEQGVLPLNPCANFTWGSVMDFSIIIGNGIDCSGFVGDDTVDPIIVGTLPYTNTGDNSYCYSNQNLVYNSPDVYYEITPSPLMQSITVSLCGSSFDTFLSVVDAFGNIVAFNDDGAGCGTSSSLTFETSGLGLAYIIVEGWGNAIGAYNISINADFLGTNEMLGDNFQIYPNPATNIFSIKGVEGKVEIIDLTGMIVLKTDHYSGENISISNLKNGIYTVQFEKNNQLISKKLTIQ